MKKTILFITLFFSSFCLFADDNGPAKYCPLETGQHWAYSFFSKKENVRKDDIHTYIQKSEEYGGMICQVYDIPAKNMRFYTTINNSGVYLIAAKVNLPVLGFIDIDIAFKPEVLLMKFPIVPAETWHYKGTAKARVAGVFSKRKRIQADFSIVGQETVEFNGGTVSAYHLRCTSSRSWGGELPIYGDCWMAENIGFIKGETKNSRLDLIKYTSLNMEAR
jgi:hypothetical protein